MKKITVIKKERRRIDEKMKLSIILFGIVTILSIILIMWEVYTDHIYKEAMILATEHQYDEAIDKFEKLSKEYKNTQIHIWRLKYALNNNKEAIIITYDMEINEQLDPSSIFNMIIENE